MEKEFGHLLQLIHMLGQDAFRLVICILHQHLDLVVDRGGSLLGIIADMPHVPAEERFAVVRTVLDRSQLVAHAVLGHHGTCDLGSALDVVGGARRDVVQRQGFGHTAAQKHHQVLLHLLAGLIGAVLRRQMHGITARHTARDNRNLMHRVLRGAIVGRHGMAGLVVCRQLLFAVRHHVALLLRAHHNLDRGLFDFRHGDRLQIPACRQQCGLVQKVFQIGAGKARGRFCDCLEIHIRGKRLAARMDLEDLLAPLDVRIAHHHLAVKTAGPHQSRVQNVWAVRGRDHNHAFVRAKAVHLHQELVQRLFALIMAAAQTCAALTAHRVDLIDKDDAGGILLRLFEQVAHTGGANADEHLHKVGTRNGEKRHARLACDCTGQQRFTGSRRAHQQNALGDARAELVVLLRILEEFYDLAQFLLFLVRTGYIGKGRLALFVGHLLNLGLAEVHLLAGIPHGGIQTFHHKPPQENAQPQHDQHGQHAHQPGGLGSALDVALHARISRMVGVVFIHIGLNFLQQIGRIRRRIVDDRLALVVELEAHLARAHIDRESRDLLIFKVIHDVRIDMALLGGAAAKQQADHQKQRNRNAEIDQQTFHFVSIVQVIHSFTEGRSAAVHLRL